MLRKYFARLTGLLSIILFCLSCNKEIEEPTSISAQVSSDSRSHRDDCRLIQAESTFPSLLNWTYNKKGLVDTYMADYMGGGYFKHEYKHGRLVISRFMFENTVLTTIYFFYSKKYGVVDHEIWYDGDGTTKVKTDEVFYLFNHKGHVRKMVSTLLDYSSDLYYDYNGSLVKFKYYSGGQLNTAVEYTYYKRFKNPTGAIPGLEYDYYSASGSYSRNKWYSTSQKVTVYENGVPTVVSDQDPKKTVMIGNKERYPTHVEYFERSGDVIEFDFTYDNCESCKPRDKNKAASASKMSANTTAQKLMLKPALKKILGIK